MRMRAYYMYGTTAKFKSANIFISAARDQTAKFKDRQYFRLYGMLLRYVHACMHEATKACYMVSICFLSLQVKLTFSRNSSPPITHNSALHGNGALNTVRHFVRSHTGME